MGIFSTIKVGCVLGVATGVLVAAVTQDLIAGMVVSAILILTIMLDSGK